MELAYIAAVAVPMAAYMVLQAVWQAHQEAVITAVSMAAIMAVITQCAAVRAVHMDPWAACITITVQAEVMLAALAI